MATGLQECGGTRCEACGCVHVIFREARDTGGVAVAKETARFTCSRCKALLFEEDVGDNEFVMVLAEDNPLVASHRARRPGLAAAASRWSSWDWKNQWWGELVAGLPVLAWMAAAAWAYFGADAATFFAVVVLGTPVAGAAMWLLLKARG